MFEAVLSGLSKEFFPPVVEIGENLLEVNYVVIFYNLCYEVQSLVLEVISIVLDEWGPHEDVVG